MSTALFDPPELTPLTDICPGARKSALCAGATEQGSGQWFELRMGIPTASEISNVVTSRGEPCNGEARKTYMAGLVGERLTRTIDVDHSTPAMERGKALEPKARAWYELETGRDVREVGFVYQDKARRWGGSPDGLCGERGIEIKCPQRAQMIKTLLAGDKIPAKYIGQVQFLMFITGLSVWDFLVWTPEPQIPNRIWTVEADAKLHAAYAEHLTPFCDDLATMENHLRRLAA